MAPLRPSISWSHLNLVSNHRAYLYLRPNGKSDDWRSRRVSYAGTAGQGKGCCWLAGVLFWHLGSMSISGVSPRSLVRARAKAVPRSLCVVAFLGWAACGIPFSRNAVFASVGRQTVFLVSSSCFEILDRAFLSCVEGRCGSRAEA